MKNPMIQVMSIGLSSISLAGSMSITALADEAVTPAADQESSYTPTIEAETSMNDAQTIADEACDMADEAVTTTGGAAEDSAAAVVALENEELTEEEAASIVDEASTSVETAGGVLQAAGEKYNNLVSEYDNAKAEYEAAVLAYATERAATQDSLGEAQQNLLDAEARLTELERQIEAAKELVYEYTDAKGQTVRLTEEEALKLDGQIEINSYWTIDGTYVPRYTDYMRYTGTRGTIFYNERSAIESGMEYVVDSYDNNKNYYKTYIVFNDDWKATRPTRGGSYETTGTFTASYNKVSERKGVSVSNEVKDSHYKSEADAVSAVEKEAASRGASGIDKDDSRLVSTYIQRYASILKKYIYSSGDEQAYNKLLSDVEQARADYNTSKEKVASLQDKLDNLKDDNSILALVQVTYLETRLEKATASYNQAKDNLAEANKNLEAAQSIYESRFAPADSSKEPTDSTPTPAPSESQSPSEAVEVPEATLPEEPEQTEETDKLLDITDLEDLEKTQTSSETNVIRSAGRNSINLPEFFEAPMAIEDPVEEINPIQSIVPELLPFLNTNDGNGNSGGTSSGSDGTTSEDTVTEDAQDTINELVQIPDAATPKDITVDGLKEHKKWFVGLAGVSAAGAMGIGLFESKRRAIAKILDKLNQ